MTTNTDKTPSVEQSEIGYADSNAVKCVRPEMVEYTNEFMKFLVLECDVDMLE